jgi:hypothetical protein
MRGGQSLDEKRLEYYEYKRTKTRLGCEHFHGRSFLGAGSSAIGWIAASEIYSLIAATEDHASRFRVRDFGARLKPASEEKTTQLAVAWDLVWLYGGSVAGSSGSADETGDDWGVADRHLVDHGCWSVSSPMEFARAGLGNVFGTSRCAARPTSCRLGIAGRMHVGRCEYAHDFCDSRRGLEHRFSPLEFEQHSWDFLGVFVFQ